MLVYMYFSNDASELLFEATSNGLPLLEDLNKLPDAGCGFALPLTSGHRGRPKYYSSRTARVPRVLFGIFQSMHSVNQTLYLAIGQDLLP